MTSRRLISSFTKTAVRPRLNRGMRGVMFRVRLIAAAAMTAMGPALAGCSGGSMSMPSLPDWMTFKPPPPPMVALQFESEPPGADVHTEQGQTCRTPCSLAVPVSNQSITFTMVGFQPQTIPVQVSEASQLMPNPVQASLAPMTPPKRPPAKPRKRPAPKPAKTTATPPPPAPDAAPPPPPSTAPDTLGNRFSPPSSSPFPPPPPAPPPQH